MKKTQGIMKVTIVPIVIGAFSTVTKGLLKGLENKWRPSKLLHYWERPEYGEESWRLEETCFHSNSSERSSANADVKNSQEEEEEEEEEEGNGSSNSG